jgi:hypothetical protein
MSRRWTLALLLLAATAAASAQRQPLTSPTYYVVTAPELVDGLPVEGALTTDDGQNFKDGSYLDVLVLRSVGDETVQVRVDSYDFDTYLVVFAPDGTLLASNDDVYDGAMNFSSRVRVHLPEAGAYLVVVSGFGPHDLGAYTATRSAYAPPPKVVVDAAFPGRYGGVLAEGAADAYWLDLTEATSVVATLRSADFDTVLEVYGDDGAQVGANDDFDGTDSQVVLDLPAGRFEFLVKGYWEEASGAYELEFAAFSGTVVERVVVDAPGSYDGVLAPAGVATYAVTLTSAATLTVVLRSADFDTYLEAYDTAGAWLDANDDFDGSDSQLVLTLEPGTYEFDVSAFGAFSSGAYTVHFDW